MSANFIDRRRINKINTTNSNFVPVIGSGDHTSGWGLNEIYPGEIVGDLVKDRIYFGGATDVIPLANFDGNNNFYNVVGHTLTNAKRNIVLGENNTITNSDNNLVGGENNSILDNNDGSFKSNSAIVAGEGNTISTTSFYAFIGGGENNTISKVELGFIGAGINNTISTNSHLSFIGAGQNNTISTSSSWSFIGAGQNNEISTNSYLAFIGGGQNNSIDAPWSFIGGGLNNTITTNLYRSFIGGGENNTISGPSNFSFIGVGEGNTINSSPWSFIGAGRNNTIDDNDYCSAFGLYNLAASDGDDNTLFVVGNGTISTRKDAFVIRKDDFLEYKNEKKKISGKTVTGSDNLDLSAEYFQTINLDNTSFPTTWNITLTNKTTTHTSENIFKLVDPADAVGVVFIGVDEWLYEDFPVDTIDGGATYLVKFLTVDGYVYGNWIKL